MLFIINCRSSRDHLEFMGIQIDGDPDKFAEDMVISGFANPRLMDENQIQLSGIFLEKNCELEIYSTPKSQTVYKVRVNLAEEIHDSLNICFDRIQKLYTSKYGPGTSRYYQFQNSDRFLFNEPKRVRNLRAGDYTRYTTKSGFITIEVRNGCISVIYIDRLNNNIRSKELQDKKE